MEALFARIKNLVPGPFVSKNCKPNFDGCNWRVNHTLIRSFYEALRGNLKALNNILVNTENSPYIWFMSIAGNDGMTKNTVMNISDVTTEQQPISRHEKDGTPP
jgi:hypothetical protein